VLDALSKKILEQMRVDFSSSNDTYYDFDEDLDMLAEKISSDGESVHKAVRYLEELGYIEYGRSSVSNTVMYFLLSHKGLHQKELDRLEIKERWKERLWGFISGVLVTVLAALIISWFSQAPAQTNSQPQTTGAIASLSVDHP